MQWSLSATLSLPFLLSLDGSFSCLWSILFYKFHPSHRLQFPFLLSSSSLLSFVRGSAAAFLFFCSPLPASSGWFASKIFLGLQLNTVVLAVVLVVLVEKVPPLHLLRLDSCSWDPFCYELLGKLCQNFLWRFCFWVQHHIHLAAEVWGRSVLLSVPRSHLCVLKSLVFSPFLSHAASVSHHLSDLSLCWLSTVRSFSLDL